MNPSKRPRFARRAHALESSAIREILKITQRPDIISFAGGLPAPESFPVEALNRAFARAASTGASAFQYAQTEGYLPLREWVAKRMHVPADHVLITTGSQQGLDLLGKVFLEDGRKVLVEAPTYLGALQAFSVYQPKFVSVGSDEHGILPDVIAPQDADDAAFLYVIPNFQNPTGRSLQRTRRHMLIERAASLGLLLIEDDPYGALDFGSSDLPTLHSLSPDGVVYLGSLSKVLAPGLRVGFVVAPPWILGKLTKAKQATDLHTSSITQQAAYDFVSSDAFPEHIASIIGLYRSRCAAMLSSLEQHMPLGVSWSRPGGGMFVWVQLPASIDATALLMQAITAGIAFVPGQHFFAHSPAPKNMIRLSFVTVSEETIDVGIRKLAALIKTESNNYGPPETDFYR